MSGSQEAGRSSAVHVLSQKTVQSQPLKETSECCARTSLRRENPAWLDTPYQPVRHPCNLNDETNAGRRSYNETASSPLLPAASPSLSLPTSKWVACLLCPLYSKRNKKECLKPKTQNMSTHVYRHHDGAIQIPAPQHAQYFLQHASCSRKQHKKKTAPEEF